MSTLVVADHDNAELKQSTRNAVTAAVQLGTDVHILVVGSGCAAVGEAAAKVEWVAKVLVADDPLYEHMMAEPTAALIVSLVGGYDAVLTPSTTSGKNFMPRAAALLDVAQLSDIVEVKSADTFVRPIYAGNAMATVQSSDAKKMITVRTTAFAPAEPEGGSATVEAVATSDDPGISTYVRDEFTKSDRPELTAARVIISGGRGMQDGANFPMLESIADKLGAAVGASRAAVDAGFVPNDYQVGQTGKVVAPELYIAVGISGAIQHLAGMKDSKVIVAINKDEEAPIFQVADYGLVADLFKAIPELDEELAK
jgi:electron transfer flavoprotein alpha subunit